MPAAAFVNFQKYGPTAAAMIMQDTQGSMAALPRQRKKPALSVISTGIAHTLRPYRGYAATMQVQGNTYAAITPHKKLTVKLNVSVGAVPSAEDIAQAVWNSLATRYTYSGTLGEKLNSISGGGTASDSKALTLAQFLALK